MTTRPLSLLLELDFEGERVTGRLADEHGNDWGFWCWLDLLTLIEQVRDSEMKGAVKASSSQEAGRDSLDRLLAVGH